jgi:hypothetical protein
MTLPGENQPERAGGRYGAPPRERVLEPPVEGVAEDAAGGWSVGGDFPLLFSLLPAL